jgi:hypothetical protein
MSSPFDENDTPQHPNVLAARARADERRKVITARNEAIRASHAEVVSAALAEVSGVDGAYLQADPFPTDLAPDARPSAPLVLPEGDVGPPFDPNLEETLANNPGLAAMIQASNPGVKIPGLSAPPRPIPGGVTSNRAHYRDGMRDVGLMQQVDPAFREGGVFAPAPGAHVGGIGGGMAGIGSAPQEGTAFRSLEVQHLVTSMEALSAPARGKEHGAAAPPQTRQQSSNEMAHLVRSMHDVEGNRSPTLDGLTVVAPRVVLRELLALAHLGVSQTRVVGGLTFRRLDVATFEILAYDPVEVHEPAPKNGCEGEGDLREAIAG